MDIIAILGMDELSEEVTLLLEREKYKVSISYFLFLKTFTGSQGKVVDHDDTIKGFDAICKGEYDHLPESAFYMVGGIEEAIAKAEKLSKESK